MKKILLAGLLTLLPLSAADFFLSYGAKVGSYQSQNIVSTTFKTSILTDMGAFGFGKDISLGRFDSYTTGFRATGSIIGFEYLHYGYLIDLGAVKIGLGYDIGGGSISTATDMNAFVQMEGSVDVLIPVGEQWAINLGYAQPWIANNTYSDLAYGRVSAGFRLISRK